MAKKLPTPHERMLNLAKAEEIFGEEKKSSSLFETLNKSNPNDIDVALRKAVELCERFGDYEGALTKITEVLKRNRATRTKLLPAVGF